MSILWEILTATKCSRPSILYRIFRFLIYEFKWKVWLSLRLFFVCFVPDHAWLKSSLGIMQHFWYQQTKWNWKPRSSFTIVIWNCSEGQYLGGEWKYKCTKFSLIQTKHFTHSVHRKRGNKRLCAKFFFLSIPKAGTKKKKNQLTIWLSWLKNWNCMQLVLKTCSEGRNSRNCFVSCGEGEPDAVVLCVAILEWNPGRQWL